MQPQAKKTESNISPLLWMGAALGLVIPWLSHQRYKKEQVMHKYMIWNIEARKAVDTAATESDARDKAATLARENRGRRYAVLTVVDAVECPLPSVEWQNTPSQEGDAGSGHE